MTTIPFLPDRLNREPVVWRGLTTRELFLALAKRSWWWLHIRHSAGPAHRLLAVDPRFGAGRRGVADSGRWAHPAHAKRGKPDSWLPQAILARLERHHLRGAQLVQHSTVWVVRRSPR